MEIENLTNPGADPVHGDLVRITHPNGATEERQWIDLPYEAPPPVYRPLAKADFTALVSTGLTSAQKLALRKDVEMELAWMEIGDLGDAIPRDHDFTTAFLEAAVTNGHLTNAKRQAVLNNWPTA